MFLAWHLMDAGSTTERTVRARRAGAADTEQLVYHSHSTQTPKGTLQESLFPNPTPPKRELVSLAHPDTKRFRHQSTSFADGVSVHMGSAEGRGGGERDREGLLGVFRFSADMLHACLTWPAVAENSP